MPVFNKYTTSGRKMPVSEHAAGLPGSRLHKIEKRPARTASPASRRKVFRRRSRRRLNAGTAVNRARSRLKNFRQATMLAVAITGFMVFLVDTGEAGQVSQQDTLPAETVLSGPDTTVNTITNTKVATGEALNALNSLWDSFFYNLPKLVIAAGTLLLAWGIVWGLRKILHHTLRQWGRSEAVISLTSIAIWLLAIGVALSVVAGDIRALVGSLGLIGLALSWSLQTPIESFTGWLLNSFQGYYRVGDRVRVGEVFGDVYRIDFLTTTVWEIGSPYQAGFVNAEQPTGRMVTFPNNEILAGSITNLTGDFPYVWDELAFSVANESDLALAKSVVAETAQALLGDYMEGPAREYHILMKKAGLLEPVSEQPEVYLSQEDSWTNLVIRYLVGARERRKWKSELIAVVTQVVAKPEYRNKIIPVYPRQQVQLINPAGIAESIHDKE